MNVLEGAPRSGVKRMVHTSTGEVYGTPASAPIRETHPLNAQLPYAATKIAPTNCPGKRDQPRRLDTRRDLTYVSDLVGRIPAVRTATTKEMESEVLKLRTGLCVSFEELFAMARRVLGVSATASRDNRRLRPDPSEVSLLQSDP